jgi:hypothetical protein
VQKEGDRASSYSADRSFFDNSLVEWNLDGPGPRSSGVESRSHLPWHRARSSRCWRTGRAGFVFRPLSRTWSSYAPGDRQHCVAKTMMGGLSSYTIFLNASNRRRRHTRCFLDTGRIELSKEPAPTTALVAGGGLAAAQSGTSGHR